MTGTKGLTLAALQRRLRERLGNHYLTVTCQRGVWRAALHRLGDDTAKVLGPERATLGRALLALLEAAESR